MQIDAEFRALIPPLQADERAKLEQSILNEGCRDALVVWQSPDGDILIDGHNRHDICTAHNLPYDVVTRDFASRDDVKLWMIRNQLARRNLTPFNRTELALQMESVIAELAKQNMIAGGGDKVSQEAGLPNLVNPVDTINTQAEIARIAEVSKGNVDKVKKVLADAPDAIKQLARSGDISIHRASEITKQLQNQPQDVVDVALRVAGDNPEKIAVLSRLYKSSGNDGSNGTFDEIARTGGFHHGDDMDDWLDFADASYDDIKRALDSVAKYHATIEQDRKRAERMEARIADGEKLISIPDIEFVHGDCTMEVSRLPISSVRLLLTDPPYGMAFQSNRRTATHQRDKIANDATIDDALNVTSRMLHAIDDAMMDECHVLMFCNWRYESQFAELIRQHGYDIASSVIWVKENHTSGDLTAFAPKHERIIHARRGRASISPRIPDVIAENRQYDTGHPTEKPVELLKQLIEVTTIKNELVVDPFAGTGATGIASLLSGRKSFLVEMETKWHTMGMDRIALQTSK